MKSMVVSFQSAKTSFDDMFWWNDSEEVGDVGSEYGEDEGTDCKDGESDTDRYRYIKYIKSKHTLCIKCTQLIVIYIFFLAHILFLGSHLTFG